MTDPPATLAAALAELQTQLPHVVKDATATVGGGRQHGYASLGAFNRELLPVLGKLGLSFTCKPTVRKGEFVLRYKLRLVGSDEVEKGWWPLPHGTPQVTGSALTYYRRYILQCLTGAVADDDDDGAQAAQVATPRPQRTRAKIPGADHERLQPRRQPDDRPAERGPVPPEDDMWAGQPAGPPLTIPPPSNEPGSADGKQIRDISIQLNTLGITDHEEQLARIERIINGPLDGPEAADDGTRRTRKNLSRAEADEVKRTLAEAIKAMKLAERAAAEQDAAAEVTP